MRPIPRPVRPRLPIALVGALVAATFAARPAEAQFGRLKELGKAAARGAVDKKTEQAVEARGEQAAEEARFAGGGGGGAPTFTDDVLEITEGRVTALLRGMDAELAARPGAERTYAAAQARRAEAERTYPARQAEYERRRATYDAVSARQEACAAPIRERYDRLGEQEAKRSEATAGRMEAEMSDVKQARLEALAERMKAAEKRGDQAAVRALADTMQREMQPFMAMGQEGMRSAKRAESLGEAMKGELAKCPNPGPEPKAPESPQQVGTEAAVAEVEAAAAKASGLSAYQYAVMKERVEAYLELRKRRPNARPRGFTAAELTALEGAGERLQRHALLGEGAGWSPARAQGS